MRRRLVGVAALAALSLGALLLSTTSGAQNVAAGRVVYTTPQVTGQLSCAAGACHTLSPSNNQNRILKAADDPGAIGVAVNTVTQMAFLKGKLTTTQFVDLAAYIGNPGGAAGTPSATLSTTALSFPSTVPGGSSSAQTLSISNTGTEALIVSSVTSSLSDFVVNGSCATIAVGASCNLSVTFTPAQVGNRAGNLTVSHNAAGGSSTVSLSGTGSAPLGARISVPSSLNFGAVVSSQASSPVVVSVSSVGTAPLIISSISSSGNRFLISGNNCIIDAPLAVNSSCSFSLRFLPSGVGTQTGSVSIQHNGSAVATVISLSGIGVAPPAPVTKTMVEYWFAPSNFYFITSRDDDKTLLDRIPDFRRTGATFLVLASQTSSAHALVRFYFDQVAVNATRGSHFYTLIDSEKAALTALNPGNAQQPRLPFNEGIDSWAFLPLVAGEGGSCAGGQTPVYRLFRGNVRFPDDPNHRYVLNLDTYREFVAMGWDGEGVQMCLPPQ